MDDYSTQLQDLLKAYTQCVEELPGNPTAVFRRYFLSDVTNQTALLMEKNVPIRIVHYPSYNRPP